LKVVFIGVTLPLGWATVGGIVAKNIILLSDGTGNSAAKEFKTNVWRLYQAINIDPPSGGRPKQVVFYDDGVGTENFKPLAYLGLAIGVGLARNIKDLYTFLCRNYEEGDGIFLFGFSRGAFTVRVLAGIILRCGLIKARNEDELAEQVELAYAAYKRDTARRARTAGRAKLVGMLLGDNTGAQNRDFVPLGSVRRVHPTIAFVGVWDTVDAYGVPVDELKQGIDRFLWPMTLADRDLSPFVERACQALSLDDERPTFRPVLWNETTINQDRLAQVWFAGVHANVGGGYPDDGLAYVAMQWVMDEAQEQGLWFLDASRADVDCRVNSHGKEYDSRSGIAGYYRYQPRDVDELSHDLEHGINVALPKVHVSVMRRIADWQVPYAPVSFPSEYEVVGRATAPSLGLRPRLDFKELAADIPLRVDKMEAAWDSVTKRRFAYAATVALTALLALLPLRSALAKWSAWQSIGDWLPGWMWAPFAESAALWSHAVSQINQLASWLYAFLVKLPLVAGIATVAEEVIKRGFGLAKGLVWSWAGLWFDWFQNHPIFSFFALCLLAWLFVRKSELLQEEVFVRADYAWDRFRRQMAAVAAALAAAATTGGSGGPGGPGSSGGPTGPGSGPSLVAPQRGSMDGLVRRMRKNSAVWVIYWFISDRIVPFMFAMLAIVGGLVILIFFIPKFVRDFILWRRYRVGATDSDRKSPARIERVKMGKQKRVDGVSE
jgi:uncharacterized protein (DUF2235 family)